MQIGSCCPPRTFLPACTSSQAADDATLFANPRCRIGCRDADPMLLAVLGRELRREPVRDGTPVVEPRRAVRAPAFVGA